MYIKAYSARPSHRPTKLQQQFTYYTTIKQDIGKLTQYPITEDRIFTDDTWFNKLTIVPHIENHRPVIKRRILRLKQDRKHQNTGMNSAGETASLGRGHKSFKEFNKESKTNIHKNNITYSPAPGAGSKKQICPQQAKNKFIAVKHSIIRQMSEIPDYARNMQAILLQSMKPCRIEAMAITNRPSTGRKISTAYSRSSRQRNSQKISSQKKQILDSPRTLMNNNYFAEFKSSNKIQPWQQADQEYHIY